VEKFTIEFYTIVEFAPPAVHRSTARGPKRKTFPQKFLENGKADLSAKYIEQSRSFGEYQYNSQPTIPNCRKLFV